MAQAARPPLPFLRTVAQLIAPQLASTSGLAAPAPSVTRLLARGLPAPTGPAAATASPAGVAAGLLWRLRAGAGSSTAGSPLCGHLRELRGSRGLHGSAAARSAAAAPPPKPPAGAPPAAAAPASAAPLLSSASLVSTRIRRPVPGAGGAAPGSAGTPGAAASGAPARVRPPSGLAGVLAKSTNGGRPLGTASKYLLRVKALPKRCRHLIEYVEAEQAATHPVYAFKTGDVVDVALIVPENNRKPATVRGVCIARRSRGLGSSFTVVQVVPGTEVLVERVIPLYSPNLQGVTVVRPGNYHRAKMYWLKKRPEAEIRKYILGKGT